MTDSPAGAPPRDILGRLDGARRSAGWGGKALLVCLLALLMAIPGMFVFGLVAERSHRADGVVAEVSNLQGGMQRILGPLLVAPYTYVAEKGVTRGGWYIVSPETGGASAEVKTHALHRGIFDVPVYDVTADFKATFAPRSAEANLPSQARIDWSRARIVIGFSDLRGVKDDLTGIYKDSAGETRVAFSPASGINLGEEGAVSDATDAGMLARAAAGESSRYGLVEAPAAAVVETHGPGTFSAHLHFAGAKRLGLLPFAKTTQIDIRGDWLSPSFDGGFLPMTRALGDKGFSAAWHVPFIARGLADRGDTDAISVSALSAKDLGVTFARANNPYDNVTRALKYAVMFVGLVFLTFFVFEALSGKRLHPAQYVLIGLAQMVFYLLLLSLSEYVGFDLAFAAAAVATVVLISLYAGWAFGESRFRLRALVIFTAVYTLIYLLMRLDDFALLAGSVASFVGLSTAMYLTRNIEWYGGRQGPTESGAQNG